MYVNDNSLVKILSFKDANNITGVCVTMYTSIEKAMKTILRDGTVFKFKEWGLGLYYYDTASTDEQNSDKTNSTINP